MLVSCRYCFWGRCRRPPSLLCCSHTKTSQQTAALVFRPRALPLQWILLLCFSLELCQSGSRNKTIACFDQETKPVLTWTKKQNRRLHRNSLYLSASPSLFLSLFLLLIDLRPQRIESHSLKTPLSCATDSKSHRENTYRKRPEKSLWRIISQINCRRKLQRGMLQKQNPLLHRPPPSLTPQNLRHRRT